MYVGHGNLTRVTSSSGRSNEHKRIWKTLDKVIINSNLTKDEASQIEHDLISKLTSEGVNLLNKVKYKTIVKPIQYSHISKILEYDLTSSTRLRWKVDKSQRSKKGSVAGYIANNSYIKLTINNKTYMGHRIIYCLLTKTDVDADLVIDHVDRNGLNNELSNLRLVTQNVNSRNRKYSNNNTTGEQGITEQPNYFRFMLRWTSNNHRYGKCFSYNPNRYLSNKFAFPDKQSALLAAVEFRDKLVSKNIITLIKD